MSLEDYGLTCGVVPVCGWTFPQSYEGEVQTVESSTGPGLVQALIAFRVKAHLPIGDPEREISIHIKAQSPDNNRFQGKEHRTRAELKAPKAGLSLIERIRDQLKELILGRPRFAAHDEIEARTDACAACPQNVLWRTKCGPCNAEVDYLALVLRQRPVYARDEELKACRLHNLHLGSAVFLDQDALPDRHPSAPAPCWVKAHQPAA